MWLTCWSSSKIRCSSRLFGEVGSGAARGEVEDVVPEVVEVTVAAQVAIGDWVLIGGEPQRKARAAVRAARSEHHSQLVIADSAATIRSPKLILIQIALTSTVQCVFTKADENKTLTGDVLARWRAVQREISEGSSNCHTTARKSHAFRPSRKLWCCPASNSLLSPHPETWFRAETTAQQMRRKRL